MRSVLAVAFAATTIGVVDGTARPTKEEWKASQKAAADKKGAAAADASKNSAVGKVISMMEGLQKQVLDEAEAEAQTYNKFACFCKDNTVEKTNAIKKGSDKKAELSATIESLSADRDELDTTIANLLADIEASAKTQKTAKAERAGTLAVYEKNVADLQAALDGLDAAIKKLKASAKPSLLQVPEIAKSVRTAALMADALGLGNAKLQKMMAFLQQGPDVPMEDYKFHSGDIIEMLEKLEKSFRDTKADTDAEEVKSVADFDALIQKETDITKAKNLELDEARKTKAHKIEEIAENSEELTTTAAVLLDDQKYLQELSKLCSNKAKTWDQRSQARQDELSALTAAIDIVKTTVAEKTSSSTIRFAQEGVRVRMAEALARSPDAMEAVEAEAEEAETPVSLLQRSGSRSKAFLSRVSPVASDGGREFVLDLLRSKGKQLHSTLLTSLASRIAADPFAKIKLLIQELIDRLLKEAANEGNQKAFCDKATADAEQKRDYAAEQIRELNGELATEEARRDTLTEELKVLDEEIADLKKNRASAGKEREEEKAENEHTVAEAKAGLEAVNMAIDVLDKYYKTNAKNKVDLSLAQAGRGPLDDAPDAGFDNGEAYTGAGGEAGGILGMLDVIKSDFERTISVTEKAEAEAAADNLEYMTKSGMSLAEKEMAHKQKTTQNEDAREKINTANDGLESQTATLTEGIKELMELKPVCVDTGMSYEERVARREDEIESLKKALCILTAYAEYGPDGLSDAC